MQGERFREIGLALRGGDLDVAPCTSAERLLLEYVGTVTKHAYRVTDAQVEALRRVGWTDPQIAEATYVAALFNMMVRIADAFGIEAPDDSVPFSDDGASEAVQAPRA